MTTRKELFDIFDEITEKAFEIMQGKNSDYASDEDSLANFRSSEVLNVDPRKALLIRMLDKIKRQVNYIERGELSVDSAEDDIIDLINYSVLLHALNREKEFEEAYEATKDKVPDFDPVVTIVDKITEDVDMFSVFNEGGKCEFISQSDVIDVETDDELTITQLETTDGTIYRT